MNLSNLIDGYIIEKAINQALKLDPEASLKLAALEGRTISVALNIREKPWILTIMQGEVVFTEADVADCDVRLRGTPEGFLQLFKGSPQGSGKKLYIEGDLHTAQQFQRVMSSIRPDFSAVLKERFGEKLGGILGDGLYRLQQGGTHAKELFEQEMKAFFTGENGRCASRADNDRFAQRLSRLRLSLDRLEARAIRLEKH